jgi:hypothetical protein
MFLFENTISLEQQWTNDSPNDSSPFEGTWHMATVGFHFSSL